MHLARFDAERPGVPLFTRLICTTVTKCRRACQFYVFLKKEEQDGYSCKYKSVNTFSRECAKGNQMLFASCCAVSVVKKSNDLLSKKCGLAAIGLTCTLQYTLYMIDVKKHTGVRENNFYFTFQVSAGNKYLRACAKLI